MLFLILGLIKSLLDNLAFEHPLAYAYHKSGAESRVCTVHKGEVVSKELGKEGLTLISQYQPQAEIGYRKEA